VHREVVRRLEHERMPHLAHDRDGSLVVLVQAGDPELRAALSLDAPDAVVGVGREVDSMADVRHSLRDAQLAAGHGRGLTHFDDFDLGTFMVSEIPPARLVPKVEEILAALRANPPLHEALRAYFAHDLDIAATAASLHMHRNSLRYRLARAEQVLGRSLKQPATIAAVYLALVADAAAQSASGGLDGSRLPASVAAP
jgi:purine catabolism regulator